MHILLQVGSTYMGGHLMTVHLDAVHLGRCTGQWVSSWVADHLFSLWDGELGWLEGSFFGWSFTRSLTGLHILLQVGSIYMGGH